MAKMTKAAPERLVFSGKLYSPEAVKLAAYVFEGRARVRLSGGGLRAEISPLASAADAAALAGEFANEALNQQCRLDLVPYTGKIAGMIVTKTLLSALGPAAAAGAKKGGR